VGSSVLVGSAASSAAGMSISSASDAGATPFCSLVIAQLLGRAAGGAGITAGRPVFLELERHRLVEAPEPDDHALQLVLALARHADRVALDLRLDLRELVADQLLQPSGELVGQAAPEPDHLAD